jgi:hypothetical protein
MGMSVAGVVKMLAILVLVASGSVAAKMSQDAPSSQATLALRAAVGSVSKAQQPCAPGAQGDQDKYVYRPERLQVLQPCLRITGTVDSLQLDSDGDVHFRIRLDPPYQALLVDGNKDQGGDLVVEPVCYTFPLHADALRLCASDPDRVQSIPQAGDHVWMEGRYVLDAGHTAWSELHPLYRWGKANP